ncbi:MAG: nitroreductase family deazaflavin-dependent oxidoreductase [Acidimicrobiia bacterium]
MAITPELTEKLASMRTIDLTTYGRKTGRPRRIEIWWFHVDGRFIISGTPGRRDWLANIRANPNVIVHAGGHDLDGVAAEIVDPSFRRHVFKSPHTRWYSTQAQLERLVETAPMIEIAL